MVPRMSLAEPHDPPPSTVTVGPSLVAVNADGDGGWSKRCCRSERRPGRVGRDGGDDRAVGAHAAYGDIVGGAVVGRLLGHDRRGRPRRAAQGDVGTLEARDGFAEDGCEVDGAVGGGLRLAAGLVDGHARGRRVQADVQAPAGIEPASPHESSMT